MGKSIVSNSQVRIIAGRWRGRKILFPTNFSIRPTPDRVRETLFNWLSPYITNRFIRGLDLYAGSGVLGFEALSRGATEMVFVDSEISIIKNLEAQHQVLKIDSEFGKNSVKYKCSDAIVYLVAENTKFDLVFIDPPYQKNMIEPVINMLCDSQLINNNGLIYIEMAKSEVLPNIPKNWEIIKNKVMSKVNCYLIQVVS